MSKILTSAELKSMSDTTDNNESSPNEVFIGTAWDVALVESFQFTISTTRCS
jgi:hypothetical protein